MAKTVCEYHECQNKGKLYKCDYCGKYFCKKHWPPKAPGLPKFEPKGLEDRLFMQEWRKGEGHPCPPFVEVIQRERAAKEEMRREDLDQILRKRKPSLVGRIRRFLKL